MFSNTKIDSLLKIASNELIKDSNVINACTKLSQHYIKQRQLNEAMKFALKAKSLAKENQYEKGFINALNAIASIHSEKGENKKAITMYNDCVDYCIKKNNQKGLMYAYNNLALTYFNDGEHQKAIEYYLKAIKIAEKENKWENIAKYYNNLSRVYAVYEDYHKAIFYVEKSIELEKNNNGNPENIIIRSINLSNYLNESGKFNEAIYTITSSLKLNDSLANNKLWEAYLKTNLGQSYLKTKKYELAIKEYQLANRFFTSSGDSINASNTFTFLANLFVSIANSEKAQNYIELSFDYAKDSELDYESRRFRYNTASKIYEKNGDYKKANDYLKLYNIISDSINYKEKIKAITDMQIKYESKLKTDSINLQLNEISFQKSANENIQKLSTQKNYLLIFLACIVIALIIASSIAYQSYKKTNKINLELIHQKKIIEDKNSENENLLSEIHHRVKNNLQVISSLLSLQGKSIGDPNAKMAIEEGKQRVKSMELVHKMLYEKSNFSSINMHDYIQKLTMHLAEAFGIEDAKFTLTLSEINTKLDIETAVPIALILNELIINSFKYAYPNSDYLEIEITLYEKEKYLHLEMKDNGIEVEKEKILNSKSFGVKLIQLLVKQLNGKMIIDSDNGLKYSFIFNEYKILN